MKKYILFLYLVISIVVPCNSQTLFRGYTAPDSSVYLYVTLHSYVPFENYTLNQHCIYSVKNNSVVEFHRTYPSRFGMGNFTNRYLEGYNFIGGSAADCFVAGSESGESNGNSFYNAFGRYNGNFGAIGVMHNIQINPQNRNMAVFNTFLAGTPKINITLNGLATYTTKPNLDNIYVAGVNPKTSAIYGVSSDGAFQVSYDSCTTFISVSNTNLYQYPLITYDKADSVFYMYGTKLFSIDLQTPTVTKNNGLSWASIQQGVNLISAGHISRRLYGIKYNRFYKSDDYGSTFTPVPGSNNLYTSLYANPYKEEVYLWQGDSAIVKWDGNSFTNLFGTVTAVEKEKESEPSSVSKPFPNPSNGSFSIIINSAENSAYQIDVFNLLGETVGNQNGGDLIKGDNKLEINLGAIPKGIYFVRVRTGENYKIEKLLVE